MKFDLSKFENLIQKIEKDEKFSYTFLSLILVLSLWWSIKVEMGFLGLISLLAYWFIVGVWLGSIIRRVVAQNQTSHCLVGSGLSDFFSLIFGVFLSIYLAGFGMAFWIVIYKINVGLMILTLAVLLIIIRLVKHLVNHLTLSNEHYGQWLMIIDKFEHKERIKNRRC